MKMKKTVAIVVIILTVSVAVLGCMNKPKYSFVLEDKTSDGIVEICDSILSNFPRKGQTYEEYESTLIARPLKTSEQPGDNYANTLYYVFVDFSNYRSTDANRFALRDALCSIAVSGIQTEMDGSIGYSEYDNGVKVTVSIDIRDYDRATEIYDKLYELLSKEYKDVSSRKVSTTWEARGCDVNGSDHEFLSMRRGENRYSIYAVRALERD